MRDIINKGLTNEELLNGVKLAWQRGWKQCKLYFMIGLPGERAGGGGAHVPPVPCQASRTGGRPRVVHWGHRCPPACPPPWGCSLGAAPFACSRNR
jgi:hypothetical protein